LTKLLTVDLPRLFVRPNKIVLDFQKGKAVGPVTVGPVAEDVKSGEMPEGNMDSVGELSVTLVDARKLPYLFGKIYCLVFAFKLIAAFFGFFVLDVNIFARK
jgi:hypothetical protein